ncbi:MAG: hypothetical protein VYA46_10275, partial [Verrucomicrobiota bacterium]|nr:hypothetical protein [Verrucomicrobiota bacterium]
MNYHWGLGIEHEYHLFHIKNKKKNSNYVIFDSQEAMCFISRYTSICCTSNEGVLFGDPIKHICCDIKKNHTSVTGCWPEENNKTILTKYEQNFLKNLEPFEYGGRPSCSQIPRIPINMVEITTTNYKNRTITSLVNELIKKEDTFLRILNKNKNTKQKVKIYGPLKQYPYGHIKKCKIPLIPTHLRKYYHYIKDDKLKSSDYTGSYDLTITLPYKKNITLKKFINMHQEFGRQIQWIEPLLICAFFSPDLNSIGDGDKYTEGSYRVMTTGWGNFAGSDVRTLEKKSINRYANIDSKWRKKLQKFQKELSKCEKGKLSSDLRTISLDFKTHYNKKLQRNQKLYKESIMKKGQGIEIRIFDHFPTQYIKNLLQIIIIIADNSLQTKYDKNNEHVYNNKIWIETMKNIMIQGWNSSISEKYINLLKKILDISFECDSNKGYDILKCVVKSLFLKNKHGKFQQLTKCRTKVPYIPQVNRYAWESELKNTLKNKWEILLKIMKIQDIFSFEEFEKIFYTNFDKKLWKNDIHDILYALESKKIVNLSI